MKVLIVNWAGLNTGDDIIFETCVQYVRSQFSDVKIGIMGHHINPDLAKKHDCRIFSSVFEVETGLLGWGALLSAIRWADAVIVGGGDILRERIASFAPFAVSAAFGRPVCGIGIGVTDRSRSKFWDLCYSILARSVTSLYVRDSNSYEKLKSFFAKNPDRLFVAPDVAFASLTPPSIELASKDSISSIKRICINLRQLHDPDYQGAIQENATELIQLILSVLTQVARDSETEIMLIPMVDDLAVKITMDGNDSDLSILQELKSSLESRGLNAKMILKRPSGLIELEEVLADANLVIGARYHFLIGALSTNATILCVPYASKVKQLLAAIPAMQLLSNVMYTPTEQSERQKRGLRVSELHQQSISAVEKSLATISQPVYFTQRITGMCLALFLVFEPATRVARRILGGWIHPSILIKSTK